MWRRCRWSPRRVVWTAQETAGWPLVHPLFVALDLAQDPDRGSEVPRGGIRPGGGSVSGNASTTPTVRCTG